MSPVTAWVPSKSHLPLVSRQSRLSANGSVIIKWYWGLCTDLLGFTLQLKRTPENQLGDCRCRLCNQSSPQMGSLPPEYIRKGEGREERRNRMWLHMKNILSYWDTLIFYICSFIFWWSWANSDVECRNYCAWIPELERDIS